MAAEKLHEMALAALFIFAGILLLVVICSWVTMKTGITMILWFGHIEAMAIVVPIFFIAAAFQPDDSFIQKRFTRMMQALTSWA